MLAREKINPWYLGVVPVKILTVPGLPGHSVPGRPQPDMATTPTVGVGDSDLGVGERECGAGEG